MKNSISRNSLYNGKDGFRRLLAYIELSLTNVDHSQSTNDS